MKSSRDEFVQVNPKVIDLISTVKVLSGLNSEELYELIKDSQNNSLRFIIENGSSIQVDVEDLAKIPKHLIAKLVQSNLDEDFFRYVLSGISLLRVVQSNLDEDFFRYVLSGISLLRTLYEIAPRHSKLEQILLDDIPLLRQLLDLIFYIVIMLNNYAQEHQPSTHITLLHSTLVATSLRLLRGFVSSHWPELVNVLVHHPKVDKFMEAVFAAVRVDIELLQIKLSGQCIDSCVNSSPSEEPTMHLCQQCEASLQFLHMLCQQKMFRDRLVKHKVFV